MRKGDCRAIRGQNVDQWWNNALPEDFDDVSVSSLGVFLGTRGIEGIFVSNKTGRKGRV